MVKDRLRTPVEKEKHAKRQRDIEQYIYTTYAKPLSVFNKRINENRLYILRQKNM